MAQTLSFSNFDSPNTVAQTDLTADTATNVSSLPVPNSADFSSGGPVLVGNPGSGTAELLTATTPSDATHVTLSGGNTALTHNAGEKVTLLFGNQIRIYRADDVAGNGTQPDDTAFSLVATIDIDASNAQTAYTDSGGATGKWYKYTYYNSSSGSETQLSASVASQAGQVHYISLDDIRSSAGLDDAPQVTNAKIARFRDAAEREINGALQAVYSLPLPQPTNPIIVQIAKNIAAGELMQDVYNTISPTIAAQGEDKANKARNGGGPHTSLAELVDRSVVLQDANYLELTLDEAHGFGGYPDSTTATLPKSQGGDGGFHFTVNKEY